ncbi:MAG: hypothetical protein RLZZ113_1666 [Pseudomonadota bacterium]
MTEPVAKLVFAAIDMELSEKGIFTAEQVPAIRRKLDKAVEQSRQQDHARLEQHDDAVGSGEAISYCLGCVANQGSALRLKAKCRR